MARGAGEERRLAAGFLHACGVAGAGAGDGCYRSAVLVRDHASVLFSAGCSIQLTVLQFSAFWMAMGHIGRRCCLYRHYQACAYIDAGYVGVQRVLVRGWRGARRQGV
jgi:hypothetical protein